MNEARLAIRASELAKACHPILAGQGGEVQGAALAELVALHLAGHIIPGAEAETAEMREAMLELFVETVKSLLPIMEAMHTLKDRTP